MKIAVLPYQDPDKSFYPWSFIDIEAAKKLLTDSIMQFSSQFTPFLLSLAGPSSARAIKSLFSLIFF
ncbi:hypothetical protein V2B37_00055 (plasmid) [Natranaerobius thermophilus JW/NM-WN-LF]